MARELTPSSCVTAATSSLYSDGISTTCVRKLARDIDPGSASKPPERGRKFSQIAQQAGA
ncbi:MAG: hypothetical protein IPM79_11290 [Polyangiaceae bacterium]|nr:hypothetical protein [Polyangiaceae bacterium]